MKQATTILRYGSTLLFLAAMVSVMIGCDNEVAPTQPTDMPIASATPTVAPAANATLELPPSFDIPPLTLVWWMPEWSYPGSGGESQRLLQEFIQNFQSSHPSVMVEAVPRPAYGKGGILDFLSITARVAPSALPDIVSIDLAEVRTAVGLRLLQPMDALLPASLFADLFPFAAQAGQIDGTWYALPFAADLDHLLYDVNRTATPPQTWNDVTQAGMPWSFPLSNREGGASDALLLQYLGAGGVFTATDGQNARLMREPLLRTLQFYQTLREQSLYHPEWANLTQAEILALYTSGQVPMVQGNAAEYLRHRNELAASGFAYVPTMDGRRVVIVNGWGLAITTNDPLQQQAAARFIQWLLEPSRYGRWSRLVGRLPTRPGGLEQWGGNDGYVAFLRDALAIAQFVPVGPRYADARRQLRQAVGDVLTTSTTAQDVVNRILGEASR